MTVVAMRPTAPPSALRPPSFAIWIGTLAGIALGAVLLFAAAAKAVDPAGFGEQLQREGLASAAIATPLGLFALLLEAGLGCALLLGLRRSWVIVPATLLVAFFVALTGRAFWLATHGGGDTSGCGCFGNLVQRSPATAFWQDTLMLVPALLLAYIGRVREQRAVRARTIAAVIVGVGTAVFAWRAPALPLDDFATRLRPGVLLGELCTAGTPRVCLTEVAPDLAKGAQLVVLAKLDDSAFTRDVDALNSFARASQTETVTVLTPSSAEAQRAFFWKWAPAFPVIETPAALLRPLYRQLPRAFRVRDGRVVATYSGLAPALVVTRQ
jgi:hypothetical protein